MASGDTLAVLTPYSSEPPASSPATHDLRNSFPCLDFDAGVTESTIWSFVMPRHYSDTTGITVYIWWASTTGQTTGGVRWEFSLMRIISETTDADSDDFAAANGLTAAAPGSADVYTQDSLAITKGANMDSVVGGDLCRFKLTRDHDHAGDDMTGDAELYGIEIKET